MKSCWCSVQVYYVGDYGLDQATGWWRQERRLSIRWSVLGSNLASAVRLETNRHPHGEPSPGPVKVSCNGLNVKIDGGGNVNFC